MSCDRIMSATCGAFIRFASSTFVCKSPNSTASSFSASRQYDVASCSIPRAINMSNICCASCAIFSAIAERDCGMIARDIAFASSNAACGEIPDASCTICCASSCSPTFCAYATTLFVWPVSIMHWITFGCAFALIYTASPITGLPCFTRSPNCSVASSLSSRIHFSSRCAFPWLTTMYPSSKLSTSFNDPRCSSVWKYMSSALGSPSDTGIERNRSNVSALRSDPAGDSAAMTAASW
mmetsp:Transcript_11199/g.24063  ORF Transcript_11199/g.24063 Transcript_11199/m.24063 type:complete len:238 (-) Transcript_11199:10-723(-)